MRNMAKPPIREINQINDLIINEPSKIIIEAEDRYSQQIKNTAKIISENPNEHVIVMLAGPSGSGKTTTAHKLVDALAENGIKAHTVSLDDFYYGIGIAPVLPDGSLDHESLAALDIPAMKKCLWELAQTGETILPIFDFITGAPSQEKRHLITEPNDVVIFEGIHALNPEITGELGTDKLMKIYVSVKQDYHNGDEIILYGRDVRLIRRIVRDFYFRSSDVENTMDMWTQVIRGEEKYIKPFKHSADIILDSYHCFEPCLMRTMALPLLDNVKMDSEFFNKACFLTKQLQRFQPMELSQLPMDSLLREFTG